MKVVKAKKKNNLFEVKKRKNFCNNYKKKMKKFFCSFFVNVLNFIFLFE